MGSVQSEIICPRCKSDVCFEDYYYKTGEGITSCPDCGYYHSVLLKRDENGHIIFLDETKGFQEGNVTWIETKIKNPFGAYRIEYINNHGQLGYFETESDYDDFIMLINKDSNKENIKDIVISRYVNDKIEKQTLCI